MPQYRKMLMYEMRHAPTCPAGMQCPPMRMHPWSFVVLALQVTPVASLITPNQFEAEQLTNTK